MPKKTVVIGLVGAVLDAAQKHGRRWEKWRPTIGLCQQEDFRVDRLYLLYGPGEEELCRELSDDLAAVSPETEVIPRSTALQNRWDFESVFAALHDVSRSLPFETERNDYYVHITTGTHVEQICLFLLTESHHFPARLIQTAPPHYRHGRSGPASGTLLVIDLDLSKYDRLARRFADERLESTALLKSGIATRNADFNRLMDRIERAAVGGRAPILLTGATGTGKSQLAGRIFELKRQRRQLSGPFVEVNAATLRGDTAPSALFGHVKGAFTGAAADRTGFLRSADGGVLFLDEICELSLDVQTSLLRALEEKRFRPVGSDLEVTSDFSLIAGTNRNLAEMVRRGTFRDDLLARIHLWTFRLPGLAERREDIAPNIDYELARFAGETGTTLRFSREAFDRFLAFAVSPDALWTANFRDLRASIERMGTLAAAGRITTTDVEEEMDRLRDSWSAASEMGRVNGYGGGLESGSADSLGSEFPDGLLDREIDRFDRVQLAEAVRVCRHSASLSEAGRILFDVSRRERKTVNDADRLRKYLARFGLDWETLHER